MYCDPNKGFSLRNFRPLDVTAAIADLVIEGSGILPDVMYVKSEPDGLGEIRFPELRHSRSDIDSPPNEDGGRTSFMPKGLDLDELAAEFDYWHRKDMEYWPIPDLAAPRTPVMPSQRELEEDWDGK